MTSKTIKTAIRAIRRESPHGPAPTAADIVVRAEGRVEVAPAADVQAVEVAGPVPADTEAAAPVEAETEVVAPKVLREEARNTH